MLSATRRNPEAPGCAVSRLAIASSRAVAAAGGSALSGGRSGRGFNGEQAASETSSIAPNARARIVLAERGRTSD